MGTSELSFHINISEIASYKYIQPLNLILSGTVGVHHCALLGFYLLCAY